ncbi:MAG: hypothetical protein ACI31A_06475 [Candidatus Limisoma sp.]
MKEKEIDACEGIDIITAMVEATKNRLSINDGNVLLLWGYVSVSVSIVVWALLHITGHPAVNWLWFLIWIIGGTATPRLVKKSEKGAMSYSDRLSKGIWTMIGWCAIFATAVCLVMLALGKDSWVAMWIFALVIVGIGVAVQGMTLREHSMVIGGYVGTFCGIVSTCMVAAGVPLYCDVFIPLFIVSLTAMFIVPGHILRRKAKRML